MTSLLRIMVSDSAGPTNILYIENWSNAVTDVETEVFF